MGTVFVKSSEGQLKAQIQLMEGVNEDTVWTWNAIGKRRGAWNLSDSAPEGTKGFLLNHIISQLLPENPMDIDMRTLILSQDKLPGLIFE